MLFQSNDYVTSSFHFKENIDTLTAEISKMTGDLLKV